METAAIKPIKSQAMGRGKTLSLALILILSGGLMGCESKNQFGFGDARGFASYGVKKTRSKVDILWVVDNSGSMATSQANVANNFNAFIQKFQQTQFDYQMAVITSDAWCYPHDSNTCIGARNNAGSAETLVGFRDGYQGSRSGFSVITPQTPQLRQRFITNILQGTNGSGSERSLQSIQAALSHPNNLAQSFPREDALLAIIILTDEEDQSAQAEGQGPDWFPDKNYFDFLSELTGSTEDELNFMVSTIGILDDTCLRALTNSDFDERTLPERNMAFTEKTHGYKGSLCDNFSDVLSGISDLIIEKTTSYKLDRQPLVSTIRVSINGQSIPRSPENGWTYDSAQKLISFHGSAIPAQEDDKVSVRFTPYSLK